MTKTIEQLRRTFNDLFMQIADRPVRRWSGLIGPKGSIIFPSAVPGEYHSLAVVAYTDTIPRISLNHYQSDISQATANIFNINTGRPKYSGWNRSDITLELTVAADELHHWPAWLWSFIRARESGDADLLLPDPTPTGGLRRDWMQTRYEWTNEAAKQYDVYRKQQDEDRQRRAAFRSRLTTATTSGVI